MIRVFEDVERSANHLAQVIVRAQAHADGVVPLAAQVSPGFLTAVTRTAPDKRRFEADPRICGVPIIEVRNIGPNQVVLVWEERR